MKSVINVSFKNKSNLLDAAIVALVVVVVVAVGRLSISQNFPSKPSLQKQWKFDKLAA
jgi:hypothetical protein